MSDELAAYRDALVRLLKQRGWTQAELAERSGISQPTISRILSGSATVLRLDTHSKLERFLDIQDALVADTGALGPAPSLLELADLPSLPRPFVGRRHELEKLDLALSDPSTTFVSLVGPPGVGKSAIVQRWLQRVARQGWRGAQLVLGRCFQGSHGAASVQDASAQEKGYLEDLSESLRQLDPEANVSESEPRKLALQLRRWPSVLILDGFECLQQRSQNRPEGSLQDGNLRTLLRELAFHKPGLVVVTSRLSLADLSGSIDHSVVEIPVAGLDPSSAALLLQRSGAERIPEEDLGRLVTETAGYPPSLRVLGQYLAAMNDGPLQRDWRTQPLAAAEALGEPAPRQLAEAWVSGYDFDAANATMRALSQLKEPATASEIVDGLSFLAQKWPEIVKEPSQNRLLLARLRAFGLLRAIDGETPKMSLHPLLQEHLERQLLADDKTGDLRREIEEAFYRQLGFPHANNGEQPDNVRSIKR